MRGICLLTLVLGGCSSAEANLSVEQCEVVAEVLPEHHESLDQGHIVFHVSDSLGGAEKIPAFSDVIAAGFTDYELKPECEQLPRPTEDCLKFVAEYSLQKKDWPNKPSSGLAGFLSDCNETAIGPKITSKDWQTLYGFDGYPTVTGSHLFTIHRLVISVDQQRAIVTLQYVCGGLCGEGYSLLLERNADEWRVLAKQPHWAS